MSGKEFARLFAADFEVFGRVQGVFFRMYTEKKAKELNIKGWCRNTRIDTVEGQIEGEEKMFSIMKDWLRKTGSPSSRIERTEFRNERQIEAYSHKDFRVKH